jgi:hypothetical protein
MWKRRCHFLIVAAKYSVSESTIEVYRTSLCLEFLQELFHVHRRASSELSKQPGAPRSS